MEPAIDLPCDSLIHSALGALRGYLGDALISPSVDALVYLLSDSPNDSMSGSLICASADRRAHLRDSKFIHSSWILFCTDLPLVCSLLDSSPVRLCNYRWAHLLIPRMANFPAGSIPWSICMPIRLLVR